MKVGQKLLLRAYLGSIDAKTKLVIFGAGENGIRLLHVLRDCGEKVDFFCDNSKSKKGNMIESVQCIGYEELKEIKDDVLVMVSPSNAADIYLRLKTDRFRRVVPKEIMDLFYFLPKEETALFPIGHYYSLYPDFQYLERNRKSIFSRDKEVLDISMNTREQSALLKEMQGLYSTLPRWQGKEEESRFRYYHGNPSLAAGDTVALHCMLRLLKPRRVIEVGSGFSSAVILDTNEYYLDHSVQCSFIEPYPALLKSLCKETDDIYLQECGLQEVELEFFGQLEFGDILFIDSTHVSKAGSDVNYLLFEILPRLKSGVYIHFHDIFYPFEYPEEWVLHSDMIWNELYVLRAFLQNNQEYSIKFFQNFMEQEYGDLYLEHWPLKEKPHGGSLWIQKK